MGTLGFSGKPVRIPDRMKKRQAAVMPQAPQQMVPAVTQPRTVQPAPRMAAPAMAEIRPGAYKPTSRYKLPRK